MAAEELNTPSNRDILDHFLELEFKEFCIYKHCCKAKEAWLQLMNKNTLMPPSGEKLNTTF